MKNNANVKLIFENVKTGEITLIERHNVSCDVGMESIASRLAGADNVGMVTYCALGTSTDVPAAADVELGAEIIRKQVSVRSSTAKVATFRTFFSTSEANATLKEIGLFGDDASATADSGTLFAHAAIDKTKTSSETLTAEWTLTIS